MSLKKFEIANNLKTINIEGDEVKIQKLSVAQYKQIEQESDAVRQMALAVVFGIVEEELDMEYVMNKIDPGVVIFLGSEVIAFSSEDSKKK